ncbi:MAG TPA: amidohydrolase family protein [Planktothrix sp.]
MQKQILIDHHAHALREGFLQLDAIGLRQAFSEARSLIQLERHLPHTLSYMDCLAKLGKFLDVNGEEQILQLRERMNESEYCNILLDDASIGAFIIDDGFKMMPTAAFARICERPVFRCCRIESSLQEAMIESETFESLEKSFPSKLLDSKEFKLVGLKTIAAYRGGLEIKLAKRDEAKADFRAAKESLLQDGKSRITRGEMYHYFLTQAFILAQQSNLPVQIHCGIGDQDEDLRLANPLCMREVLESPRFSKTKFVFLHCYPYVREAAYLCSIYPNVYMDISLVSFQASPAVSGCFRDALSVAPASKILASTDGHSVPETYWYGAQMLKHGLAHCLDQLIAEEFVTAAAASEIAGQILHGNARELYDLEGLK